MILPTLLPISESVAFRAASGAPASVSLPSESLRGGAEFLFVARGGGLGARQSVLYSRNKHANHAFEAVSPLTHRRCERETDRLARLSHPMYAVMTSSEARRPPIISLVLSQSRSLSFSRVLSRSLLFALSLYRSLSFAHVRSLVRFESTLNVPHMALRTTSFAIYHS
jgi:hypothetical protein